VSAGQRPPPRRWVELAYRLGAGGSVGLDRIALPWRFHRYVRSPLEGVEAWMVPVAFGAVMPAGRLVDAIAVPAVVWRRTRGDVERVRTTRPPATTVVPA